MVAQVGVLVELVGHHLEEVGFMVGEIGCVVSEVGPMVGAIGPWVMQVGPMVRAIGARVGAIGPHVRQVGLMVGQIGPRAAMIGDDLTVFNSDRSPGKSNEAIGMRDERFDGGRQGRDAPVHKSSRPHQPFHTWRAKCS